MISLALNPIWKHISQSHHISTVILNEYLCQNLHRVLGLNAFRQFQSFFFLCIILFWLVCADDVPHLVCSCKTGSDVKITHCLLFQEWYWFHCDAVTMILWIVMLLIHFLDFVLQFVEQDLIACVLLQGSLKTV